MNCSNKLRIVLIVLLVCSWSAADSVNAGELSSGRSLALSGAMTVLANGVDAARFNPANLGLNGYAPFQVELISFGFNVSNNSWTLDDYNKYSGATLSASDKADILDKIPNEGWNFKADAEAAALSLALGKFALSFSGVGAADANLNKEIIELLLNGNTFTDSVVATGSYSDGIAYAKVGLSYGHLLYNAGDRQLAVGGTLKYLRGIGLEEIVELKGLAATMSTGFQGNGEIITRTASGGTGFALDLGGTLKVNRDYTIGARLENVLGLINWNKNAREHGYIVNFDTLTINNAGDVVVDSEYTNNIASFSTRLPVVMNLGAANTSGKLLWAVDWEQGFKRTAESSTKPRLSIGIEWLKLGIMPLRAGFSFGGGRGESYSFGSGFDLGPYYLDFAGVTGSGLSIYSAKGLKVAFSTGFRF